MITTETSPLMLAVCRDITERRKTEQDREELKKKIVSSQKAELVGILTGGIAHDFNNVLTALTGYISLLQGSLGTGSQAAEYAQKVADIAAKGQALTGRLMSFIRKKRDELVPVDIHKTLKETESLLRPNSKSVKISLELGAGNCMILGDESQIQSAFLNLGINARDAMPEGGKLIFKTYNEEGGSGLDNGGGGTICIDVTDTGTGIDEKIIKKIFDPLFTTKAPGEGTGLGLPGVLYCVKNLHGSIDVNSAVGKGTTFKIILPLLTENSQTKIDLSNKEVLVITHDNEVSDMIIDRLSLEGISVRHFNEAASALGRLKVNADNVAVIIVDYELPMFDEKSFADGVSETAPDTLIIKTLCKDQISLGSNKDYAAFANAPIDSDGFFESITMYIRDLVLGTPAG
jgi:nitrogen-specific signal transduction histidine kinase